MIENLSSLLRRDVLSNTTLDGLIGGRIYLSELAVVRNPVFPCICFSLMGGIQDYIKVISYQSFKIWVWSQYGFEECQEIYDIFLNTYHQTLLTYTGVDVVVKAISTPIMYYDEVSELYAFSSEWEAKVARTT